MKHRESATVLFIRCAPLWARLSNIFDFTGLLETVGRHYLLYDTAFAKDLEKPQSQTRVLFSLFLSSALFLSFVFSYFSEENARNDVHILTHAHIHTRVHTRSNDRYTGKYIFTVLPIRFQLSVSLTLSFLLFLVFCFSFFLSLLYFFTLTRR